VKKFFSITATILAVVGIFAFQSFKTQANKTVFGGDDRNQEIETAKRLSLEVLRGRTATLRAAGNADFKVERADIDELKMAHTRFRQTVDDVPVWEGEAIVHLNSDGSTASVTDDLKESIAVSTQANLSAADAVKAAMASYKGSRRASENASADLWIFRSEDRDHLAYRVLIDDSNNQKIPSMPVIFIDAQTGENIYSYDNLQTGTGSSRYSGTVSLSTSVSGSTYYMEDLTRKQGTFNMNNTGNTSTGTGGTQSRYTDADDVWNTSAQQAGVDAHYGAAKTFDYYKNVHARNGIDGNYGPGSTTAAANSAVSLLVSRVHFGSGYNNAFWNGTNMTYGDGDGSQFTPLTTIDICGHEMTHGVTERTANLTYSKESGALNEAMSDIMGSMVELYADGGTVSANTWLIGEDAYTPGTAGDALRSMSNPNSVGDPDHYSLRIYSGTCTPSNTNDQCGVHTNSSIVNHTYYLNAAGGTNRVSGTSVPGIGTGAAEKIWYRALTTYMTSGTTFSGARTATLNAATDLYGASSAQYSSVATAWCAVGVGSCPTTGGTPTPTPAPTATPTPAPTGAELIVNGGFEGGSVSPWVLSSTGAYFNANSTYPHSGTGYINLGVDNSVTGTAYQTVSIPSTATGSLSFWLNITSSETGTTAYDNLYVEVRNTSGTLLTTLGSYSNANKGTAGVYSQKSFSLANYRGQTVRLQFRATMDSSVTTAFRVDDVSVK
jgi:Zn-dependent metalloprotease